MKFTLKYGKYLTFLLLPSLLISYLYLINTGYEIKYTNGENIFLPYIYDFSETFKELDEFRQHKNYYGISIFFTIIFFILMTIRIIYSIKEFSIENHISLLLSQVLDLIIGILVINLCLLSPGDILFSLSVISLIIYGISNIVFLFGLFDSDQVLSSEGLFGVKKSINNYYQQMNKYYLEIEKLETNYEKLIKQ